MVSSMAKTRGLLIAISYIFVSLQLTCTGAFPPKSQSLKIIPPRFTSHHDPIILSLSDYNYEELEETSARKRRGTIRVSKSTGEKAEEQRQEALTRHQQALQDPTLLTNVQFQERDDIHPATKRALLEVMGLQAMTEIQSKTYAEALSGNSVVARSRTGTGKTLAFLIPALERILLNEQRLYHRGRNIGVLVVAPTRELALQITDQAKQLLTFHSDEDLSVLCLYGGTKMQKDVTLLNQNIPTILVVTVGRLQAHLEQTRLRGRKFSDIVAETTVLVLDEMDQLLQSFPREMKEILSFLPRSDKRQTLMFSATLPKKLMSTIETVLPSNYTLVDSVKSSQSTKKGEDLSINQRTRESYVVLETMNSFVSAVVKITLFFLDQQQQQNEQQKIIAFFPTARLVKFFAELFNVGIQNKNLKVFQMHSQMSQSARNRARDEFGRAKTGILFTTDLSARGLDYKAVTMVIQFGYPKNSEQYIHRIGRTGRAGCEGAGLLVLFPFETKLLSTLQHRGLDKNSPVENVIRNPPDKKTFGALEHARQMIGSGNAVLAPAAETAYLSLLAHYSARAQALGMSGEEVLRVADSFLEAAGLQNRPKISPSLLGELKLSNLHALDTSAKEKK